MATDDIPQTQYALGHYTWGVHWIRSHVGVWRGECQRCGLFVQSKEGQGGYEVDILHERLKSHVCDPGRKLRRHVKDESRCVSDVMCPDEHYEVAT